MPIGPIIPSQLDKLMSICIRLRKMCSKGGEEHGDSSFPEPTVQTNLLNMGLMAAIIEGCQLPHPTDLQDPEAKVVLNKVRILLEGRCVLTVVAKCGGEGCQCFE
jgi:hypothetical protein